MEVLKCSICNEEKEDDGFPKCDKCHNLINCEPKTQQ